MPAAAMREIVGPARAAGRGVGAFNVIGIEHAEAIVAGAEAAGAPVVLQVSENCAAYHGALGPIARACLAVARVGRGAGGAAPGPRDRRRSWCRGGRRARLRVGHVRRVPAARTTENVRRHRRGRRGGATTGGSGSRRSSARSAARTACTPPRRAPTPDEAAGFVAATGVDALAVAVGSSHAMLTRDAVLDLGLIARLRRARSASRWCCTARPACRTRTWPRRSGPG